MNLIPPWRLDGPRGQIDIPSRKARALLACLVLSPGQGQGRGNLATLFWGDSDGDKARASLRQVISGLRATLEPQGAALLSTSAETVVLVPGMVRTDLDAVFGAIRQGLTDDGDIDGIANLPTLLADLRDVSDEFERFVARAVDQAVTQAGRALKGVFDDLSHPAPIRLRAAQVAWTLDDLDEAALRAQMTCLVDAGNSAAALRLYGAFHGRLQNGMDAEPSPETQDLAVQIKLAESRPAPPARAEAAPLVTVAVLPFEFLGAEPVPDYVAIGLLDQITCQLAGYRAPAVISSNTMRRYLGAVPDVARLRTELRAKYVVSGSVVHQGGQAAVSVQLVETGSTHVVWAGTYHCAASALFDIRASLAETIAAVIMPSVDVAELRTAIETPSAAREPYHLTLRAKDLIFRLDRSSLETAGALLEQAVAQAPLFAPAHALLGEWHLLRFWQGWGPPADTARDAVQHHLTRAITLSPGDGRAMALWGHCRVTFAQDQDGALRLIETALTLRPNDSETLVWATPTLAFNGHAERAVGYAQKALDLSPMDPFRFRNEHFLSIAQYCAGDYVAAAESGLSCFRRVPDYASNLRMSIASLVAAGRTAEARPLVAQHQRQEPDFSVSAFLPRHGLRDAAERRVFGERLIAAGLSN